MAIPLRDFFRNPDKTGFKISKDGTHISWLASVNNRLNIHIQNRETEEIKCITNQTERDIMFYFWLNNSKLAFLQDTGGDENEHLYITDLISGESTDVTPFENVKTSIVDELIDEPEFVLIQMNKRNPVFFDVYKLNALTGELKLVEENPGNITQWITDHTGAVRMAMTTDGVNTSLLYRKNGSATFENILTTNFKEGIMPVFFDFDNKQVYALSNLNRDKMAVVLFDPETAKETEVLFEHDAVDISGIYYSRKRKVITYAKFTTWKTELHFFDDFTKQVYENIRAQINYDAEIYITARNKAEDIFIIRTLSDKSLGNYYIYDVATEKLTHLANVSPWLDPNQLQSMQAIEYSSRDGLKIHGYLTLPADTKLPVPVIVNPHGGPWARDEWHFQPDVQFLANRGFAVLQMNFRGSTGYGRTFLESSFKEWGKKMQDDITDGVHWLIDKGIADKNRIGIYGGSYGGYATLAGLAFTPDLYACGVDYVGVSNLFTFMQTIPPYWEPYLEMMYEMVGNPETDKTQFENTSPVFHADKIKVPLFIAQGAKDPRVVQAESDQMVEAMRNNGVEVKYMVKENEGHGFANEENRFEFYEAMEQFFTEHLLNTNKNNS
ncbi:MAG: S9 family peptidase [Chitinophagales bacterium]|nr:S9 family peptidase [Chitinophagales bacterium]